MTVERMVLSDALTEIASVAADPFDVSELVHRASDLACRVLSIDAAIIYLSLDGATLEPAGNSAGEPAIGDLFLDGAATPCHDALRTGAPVTFDETNVSPHFADFAVIADRVGARGVLAVPLRHRDRSIGVLCLMRMHRRWFPSHTVESAQKIADVIAAGIVRERAHRAALEVTAQLEHALQARVIVEQAKGMIAADLGISVGEALDLLRRFARSRHLRLADVATDVVNRELPTLILGG